MLSLLLLIIGAFLGGALGALLAGNGALNRWLTALGAGVGSAAALTLGLAALLTPKPWSLAWSGGGFIAPDGERFHPRQRHGDADPAEKRATGELVGVHNQLGFDV